MTELMILGLLNDLMELTFQLKYLTDGVMKCIVMPIIKMTGEVRA